MERDDDGPEGQPGEEYSSCHVARLAYPRVIQAVFFDWGNTLVAWEFDPELFVEGHVRGLAAFGAGAPPQAASPRPTAARLLPLLVGEREDEVDYTAEIGALLGSLGVEADSDAVDRFVVAEHRVWRPHAPPRARRRRG